VNRLGQNGYKTIPYDIAPSLRNNYIKINIKNKIPPNCDLDRDKNPLFVAKLKVQVLDLFKIHYLSIIKKSKHLQL
jgi:hypothetical protein